MKDDQFAILEHKFLLLVQFNQVSLSVLNLRETGALYKRTIKTVT